MNSVFKYILILLLCGSCKKNESKNFVHKSDSAQSESVSIIIHGYVIKPGPYTVGAEVTLAELLKLSKGVEDGIQYIDVVCKNRQHETVDVLTAVELTHEHVFKIKKKKIIQIYIGKSDGSI